MTLPGFDKEFPWKFPPPEVSHKIFSYNRKKQRQFEVKGIINIDITSENTFWYKKWERNNATLQTLPSLFQDFTQFPGISKLFQVLRTIQILNDFFQVFPWLQEACFAVENEVVLCHLSIKHTGSAGRAKTWSPMLLDPNVMTAVPVTGCPNVYLRGSKQRMVIA